MKICLPPRMLRSLGMVGATVLLAGCQDPRGPVSINSDDPDLKIQAIQRDVCDRNTSDIPKMVSDLQSDDAAIRFYAISALKKLTHDDFGYRFYEDQYQRVPAVARWQRWLKSAK